MESSNDKILSKREVCKILNISQSTLWRKEKRGDFPRRKQVSIRRVGWLASEVNKHLYELELAKQRID